MFQSLLTKSICRFGYLKSGLPIKRKLTRVQIYYFNIVFIVLKTISTYKPVASTFSSFLSSEEYPLVLTTIAFLLSTAKDIYVYFHWERDSGKLMIWLRKNSKHDKWKRKVSVLETQWCYRTLKKVTRLLRINE